MARPRLFYEDLRFVRKCLRESRETAKKIHDLEFDLIVRLEYIDRRRYFVKMGFKSLRSYCERSLRFTRRQSQSLESAVREYRIAVNIGQMDKALAVRSMGRAGATGQNSMLCDENIFAEPIL